MNSFAQRLKKLIGERTVSAFARQVGMNESLIRKYLSGSEPSISKAAQIADKTNSSLYWLATGLGSQADTIDQVDDKVLQSALSIVQEVARNREVPMDNPKLIKLVFVLYQNLYIRRQSDGFIDLRKAAVMARRMANEENL
ncbi:helix-turn-helix domain-containing protein [Gynuella sp.]|uniref:helix-turn-helix domain-containing protein n=1 Tax=Gynuella sp. TaxID=2969146 RepID=UPI003D109BD5